MDYWCAIILTSPFLNFLFSKNDQHDKGTRYITCYRTPATLRVFLQTQQTTHCAWRRIAGSSYNCQCQAVRAVVRAINNSCFVHKHNRKVNISKSRKRGYIFILKIYTFILHDCRPYFSKLKKKLSFISFVFKLFYDSHLKEK